MSAQKRMLVGPRFELSAEDDLFPQALSAIASPPKRLYVVGDPHALKEGLAVVGARKATPYGLSCARHFAGMAAERGIAIVSGGARGCDAAAHEAALDAGGTTVAFLGGGCDELYPAANAGMFQRIVDARGAVVSEHEWSFKPLPYTFRERNRLIAGLAKATLIVEAGLPSGTFSTADEALAANREVLAVPGAVTSPGSRGANRLIYQGATPVVDDETFADQLFSLFGVMKSPGAALESARCATMDPSADPEAKASADLAAALSASQMTLDEMRRVACAHLPDVKALPWLMRWLAEAQRGGAVAQYPDGRFGPRVQSRL